MPSTASSPAAAAVAAALRRPDGPLAQAGPPTALSVAAPTAVGLTGAAAFLAVLAAGIATAGVDGGPGAARTLQLAAVPPLTFLLCAPPLYLATSLTGRNPGLLRLLAVASAGPTAAGTWLGAAAPLLLLYLLTGGAVQGAFLLLALGLAAMGVGLGAWGALRTARRAGASAPPLPLVLGHYAFTLWTGLVLAIHLLR